MHREVLFHSFEGREMELVTLSSRKGLSKKEEREVEFDEESLCPNKEVRPYKFENKPVIFLTSRVHPGETPASYVLNGILNFLTGRKNPQ